MIKERTKEIKDYQGIKDLINLGFSEITIISEKKFVHDTGFDLVSYTTVIFTAEKAGEDIAAKFTDLCESLDKDGQNIFGELEYELATDFDSDGAPIETEELYSAVVAELKKKGVKCQ